jgi:soluble lytic murein transglycosylase-like protein
MNKWITTLALASVISVISLADEANTFYGSLSDRVSSISAARDAVLQEAVIAEVIISRNPHVTTHDALRYAKAFYEAHRETGTDIALMLAVAEAESRFNPAAISDAGARGLMQIMPLWADARTFGFLSSSTQLFNPETSIRAAAHILAQYAVQCGPEVQHILACYHGGPRARFRPAAVTVNYIRDVKQRMVSI